MRALLIVTACSLVYLAVLALVGVGIGCYLRSTHERDQ